MKVTFTGPVESGILLVPARDAFYFSSPWRAALRSTLMISGSVDLRTSSIATGHSEGPLMPPSRRRISRPPNTQNPAFSNSAINSLIRNAACL
jgi:hypothetical protein